MGRAQAFHLLRAFQLGCRPGPSFSLCGDPKRFPHCGAPLLPFSTPPHQVTNPPHQLQPSSALPHHRRGRLLPRSSPPRPRSPRLRAPRRARGVRRHGRPLRGGASGGYLAGLGLGGPLLPSSRASRLRAHVIASRSLRLQLRAVPASLLVLRVGAPLQCRPSANYPTGHLSWRYIPKESFKVWKLPLKSRQKYCLAFEEDRRACNVKLAFSLVTPEC